MKPKVKVKIEFIRYELYANRTIAIASVEAYGFTRFFILAQSAGCNLDMLNA